MFWKNKDGIWDAPNCSECCSDCSEGDEDCTCPLDFGESCENCIFKDEYTKCRECCTNPRTQNEKYIQLGYFTMCDDCIKKYTKQED